MSKRDQLIQNLGAAILNDEGLTAEPWEQLVITVKFFETSSRLSAVAFLKKGDAYVSPENDSDDGVQGILTKLRKTMAKEDKTKPFVACLVRVSRDSGEIDVDFEYDDATRWDFDFRDDADKLAKLKPKG